MMHRREKERKRINPVREREADGKKTKKNKKRDEHLGSERDLFVHRGIGCAALPKTDTSSILPPTWT
jgi:hypothetical protein